jgi:hypothetical protein
LRRAIQADACCETAMLSKTDLHPPSFMRRSGLGNARAGAGPGHRRWLALQACDFLR